MHSRIPLQLIPGWSCSATGIQSDDLQIQIKRPYFDIVKAEIFKLFHNQVIPCSWEPEALVTMVLDADVRLILTYPSESPTSRGAGLQLTTI
jgi:hypothetical protein